MKELLSSIFIAFMILTPLAAAPTSTTTLYPVGDGTINGFTTSGGAVTNLYAEIDEGAANADTVTYVRGGLKVDESMFVDLTNTSSIFINATAVNVSVRHRMVQVGDDGINLYYQIFASDETTQLTTESAAQSMTTAWVDTEITLTVNNNNNNKTNWDGARLRIRQDYLNIGKQDNSHGEISFTDVIVEHNIDNVPPSITTDLASTPATVYAYEDINYSITATDSEGDNYSLVVCDAESASGYPGSCTSGSQLCVVSAVSNGSQAQCTYTTTQSDAGTVTGYGYVCDEGSGTCTGPNQTSTTVLSTKPHVNSITVTPNPGPNGTSIAVEANITDNEVVASVTAIVSYPNGTFWQNLSLSQADDIWSDVFTSPTSPLGNYTIRIWANETNNEVNDSESAVYVPYIVLSESGTAVIDGAFSDWDAVAVLTDVVGDAGSSVTLDEKGRLQYTGVYPDEELVIGSALGIYVYEWNRTNSSYYRVASYANPYSSYFDALIVANVTPDSAMQIVTAGDNVVKVFNYSEGTITLIDTITPSYSALHAYAGNADTSDALEEIVVDSLSSVTPVELYKWNSTAGTFTKYQEISRISTTGNYFAFIENVDGIPGDEVGLQAKESAVSSNRIFNVFRNDTYENYANYSLSGSTHVNDNGAFWDFDKDGILDLALGGSTGILTVSNGSYAMTATYTAVPASSTSQSIAAGDFNGDTCGDIAVGDGSEQNGMTISIWEGDCTASNFANVQNLSIDNDRVPVGIGTMDSSDIDGDGYYDIFLYERNDTSTILWMVSYNDSTLQYEQSYRTTMESSAVSGTAVDSSDIDADSVAPSSGGSQYDISNYSLAHNSSHVLGRVAVEGALDFTTSNYTLYVSVSPSTGNTSAPTGALAFPHDFRVVAGSICTVLNNSGSTVGSCSLDNSSSELEIAVSYSALGLSDGDSFNATWESAGTARYDLAPDADSFISYTVGSSGGGNSAPVITAVQSLDPQTPLQNSALPLTINFTASDADGHTDLDGLTASIVVWSGSSSRTSSSCTSVQVSSTAREYECSVDMQYYDAPGSWTINASVDDISSASALDSSTSFIINILRAWSISPASINFGTHLPGASINASDDPLVIDNQGNVAFDQINLTGYDLVAGSYRIGAGNVTVNSSDAPGQIVQNASAVVLLGVSVPVDTASSETNISLFLHMSVPAISAGSYMSQSSWIIEG